MQCIGVSCFGCKRSQVRVIWVEKGRHGLCCVKACLVCCVIVILVIDVCYQYLPALRLSQADILDVFSGIQFQPLDKNTYLRVQCFINQLEAAIPEVLYSVLLYNDSLAWLVSAS